MSVIPAWAPQWYHDAYAKDPRRGMELWSRHRKTERRRIQSDRAFERTKDARAADDLAMLVCAMRAPNVLGLSKEECRAARACFACGGELPESRLYWCSDDCVRSWKTNHEWSAASAAALARDGKACVRCGATEATVLTCFVDGEPWPCELARAYDAEWTAYGKGGPLPTRQGHAHHGEIDRAASIQMEVNHIEPRNGRGYHQGCHHHLDRLESLCHPCHVVETNQQRADRVAGAPLPLTDQPPIARSLDAHSESSVPTPAAPPIDYGSTLGIPSAGAWDIAS